MSVITVRTKQELESAKNKGYSEITVQGSLADKLKKSKKVAFAGAAVIAIIGAALITVPMTGGLSAFAAAPIAALTGVEIAAIIAAASIGLALVVAVFKDYEEISYRQGELVLRKRG